MNGTDTIETKSGKEVTGNDLLKLWAEGCEHGKVVSESGWHSPIKQ